MISDLKLNEVVTETLVVMAATARETKAKKPYLSLELFDGKDKISGNYWDWAGKNIPPVNTILDVTAQVNEWQGVKQLNIRSLATNTTATLNDFTPRASFNLHDLHDEALAMVEGVENGMLRGICVNLLVSLKDLWLTAPAAKAIHHAYIGGTLVHSLSVAKMARQIATVTPGANKDLCVAGGLLHDVGKLYAYKMNGLVAEMTEEGMLYEHLFMGAEFLGNFVDGLVQDTLLPEETDGVVELLRHIILSHHGKLEYGSPVPPACIEAHIVHHADMIDAAAEIIRDASVKAGDNKFTDRIYVLDNRPHLSVQYVWDTLDAASE